MPDNLESASWYKVRDLAPRLRTHVTIRRQIFRGQIWYVMEDRAGGKFHRFSPTSYIVICMMDGHRSMQEIWDAACAELGDDVLTQDDMIRLLSQLHQADVLHTDTRPDIYAVHRRTQKMRRKKRLMSFMNPMAIRIPLIDPDQFLDATYPLLRPILNLGGLLALLGTIFYAGTLAAQHWSELTHNLVDRILATESLLLLFLTYPLVKAVHELGHAYLVKKWGGQVHEMGIMFLVFMPVPYVDASAASAFREKYQRALVGAAGVLVELFLASLAMLVWVNADDPFLRAAAFNVMFIGGVSTLLFNGNPLLRFDGYYVLADLIEIPNLGVRSNRYIGYLIQKYMFGVENATSPVSATGEARWFFFYAILAFLYRIFIMIGIITFVASKFFIIGIVLAIWGVFMMVVLPLSRHLWFLLTAPVLRRTRGRAFVVTATCLAALIVPLFVVPIPYATVAEGVVWVDGEGVIYAGADGEVSELVVKPNGTVDDGAPLLRLYDPILQANVDVVEAEVRGISDRLNAAVVTNAAESVVLRQRLEFAERELAEFVSIRDALLVHAPTEGEVVLPSAERMVGSYVRKGEMLGYVIDRTAPSIVVIVPETEAELVANRTERVEVRFAESLDVVHAGAVLRQMPLVSDQLPSPVLSSLGGGAIPLDPTDPERLRALERIWQLEIAVSDDVRLNGLGGRAYVRFDHGREPLANRAYRSLRQYFLSDFNV